MQDVEPKTPGNVFQLPFPNVLKKMKSGRRRFKVNGASGKISLIVTNTKKNDVTRLKFKAMIRYVLADFYPVTTHISLD